ADAPIVHEVRLEPEDRLDAVGVASLVELDGAVHDAVVGQTERRLAELGRAGRQLVDLARAVEQRVLGVDVEMRAAGGRHGLRTLGGGSDGFGARPAISGRLACDPARVLSARTGEDWEMESKTLILQYLDEAHAMETALVTNL